MNVKTLENSLSYVNVFDILEKNRVYYCNTLSISRWGGGLDLPLKKMFVISVIRVSINSMFNSGEPTRYILIDVLQYLSHNMT